MDPQPAVGETDDGASDDGGDVEKSLRLLCRVYLDWGLIEWIHQREKWAY